MKYITIDFRISNFKTKNIALNIEEENRIIAYTYFKLGNDFIDISDGTHTVEETDCPFCGTNHKCFISQQIFSADNQKRILGVQCPILNKSFLSYQEALNESLLN